MVRNWNYMVERPSLNIFFFFFLRLKHILLGCRNVRSSKTIVYFSDSFFQRCQPIKSHSSLLTRKSGLLTTISEHWPDCSMEDVLDCLTSSDGAFPNDPDEIFSWDSQGQISRWGGHFEHAHRCKH